MWEVTASSHKDRWDGGQSILFFGGGSSIRSVVTSLMSGGSHNMARIVKDIVENKFNDEYFIPSSEFVLSVTENFVSKNK